MALFQSSMQDPFDLRRFVDAQNPLYATVLDELHAGQKRSHWMWFVFPQTAGLGQSPTAIRYAIKSREEALAYVGHPVLWPRLLECTLAVLAHKDRNAHEIFGFPDDLKFCSSMTLFHMLSNQPIFFEALNHFYDKKPDKVTINIVHSWDS